MAPWPPTAVPKSRWARFYRTTPELRAAAAKRFLTGGRGFKAGDGGGRQKKYLCSGAAPVVPPPRPGDIPHVRGGKSKERLRFSQNKIRHPNRQNSIGLGRALKITGLPRIRFTEEKLKFLQYKTRPVVVAVFYYYFFYWRFGSGRTFLIQCFFSFFFFNFNGRTLNGSKREASSECPCLARPYEGYYFVIVEVFCVALRRRLISNTVKKTKSRLFFFSPRY